MMFLEAVTAGMQGQNTGLKCGLPKLGKFINNIQRARMYVIGGSAKSGKTAIIDEMFVLSPFLLEHKTGNIKLKIKYFSYEISKIEKMAKFCAFFMYENYGITDTNGKPFSSNYILSKGEYKLNEEHYKIVEKIYNDELNELFGNGGVIDFYEDRDNPYGIANEIHRHAEANGEYIYKEYDFKCDNGTFEKRNRRVGYRPSDPKEFVIVICDHADLIRATRNMDSKHKIDELGRICVEFRNLVGYSFVIVQQLNREMGKTDRLKFSGDDLQPMAEDFKNTGNLIEDANLVIAIFNPSVYKHIHQHLNYDIDRLGKYYRSVHILQSRETECFVNEGLFFLGEIGNFTELPEASNLQSLEKFYNYIKNVDNEG
jgi:hypothetical protein